MFTGIIEQLGVVRRINPESGNVHFDIEAPMAGELKIDQSVAHNGVCLTVIDIGSGTYRVTAIEETLKRSNMGLLNQGDTINLERCMPAHGRFDGHIVQGHVDQTARCVERKETDGSWYFSFEYNERPGMITVEKGSVTVNGVSLTVVESRHGFFSVAIIPYTFEHTNFKDIKPGSVVNLEFDIVGKYVARLLASNG